MLGVLMAVQAGLGLALPRQYHDASWIRAPLYIALVLLAASALGVALVDLDASAMAARVRHTTMLRVVAADYVVVALGLTTVWLGMWAAHVFAGRSTPVEPEVFKLVAALDLTIMVPALATGGVLLWRRRPWGYVLSTIAGVQATLYLLVLSVASAVAIGRGLAEFPGELPIWGTLMVMTGAATTLLITHAHT